MSRFYHMPCMAEFALQIIGLWAKKHVFIRRILNFEIFSGSARFDALNDSHNTFAIFEELSVKCPANLVNLNCLKG